MSVHVIMPKWGLTMKQGKVTRWFKSEGDPVKKGEPLFEVETEKITNSVESPGDGILFQIVVPPGTKTPVGTILAIIAEPGEQPERMEGIQAGEMPAEKPAAGKAAKAEPAPKAEAGFVPASPAARKMAKELDIDISRVPGTGPNGRVTEADVQKFHEEGPPLPPITPLAAEMARQAGLDITAIEGTGEGGKITREDVERAMAGETGPQTEAESEAAGEVTSIPYSGMRRAIGDNMMASLQNAAQLTSFVELDVTEMVRFRDAMKEEYKKDETVRISYNDIIILAVSRALKFHPVMNSTLIDEEILLHSDVHMGMAVALPEGLIVPVLRNASRKGLLQIAREARELAAKARSGSLSVDEVTGGTFTISNTSMFQVDGFTPILRPPETGILGVGRIVEKPSVFQGQIAIRQKMTICLTYDHRVVDGAPAHAFLQTLGRFLENPCLIMS